MEKPPLPNRAPSPSPYSRSTSPSPSRSSSPLPPRPGPGPATSPPPPPLSSPHLASLPPVLPPPASGSPGPSLAPPSPHSPQGRPSPSSSPSPSRPPPSTPSLSYPPTSSPSPMESPPPSPKNEDAPPPPSSSSPPEGEGEKKESKPKRCFIVEELLSTELGYLAQLEALDKFYVGPLSKFMSNEDAKKIWLNLTQIIFFHKDFSGRLQEVMEKQDHFSVEVGEILVSMVPFMKMYTVYMNGFKAAQDRLMELTKDGIFSAAISGVQAEGYSPGMAGLTLLQGCPLSRIPRYVLLLKDLLKHTPEEHNDHAPLEKALAAVTGMANTINERKRFDENQERMREIDLRLKGDKSELLKVQMALSRNKHNWEKHHFSKPVDCAVCGKTIYGLGIQGFKCTFCKMGVHTKCEAQAVPVCIGARITEPTLVKHDRVFYCEGKASHTRIATGLTASFSFQKDLKRTNECVLFFFNDGVLVCYPSDQEEDASYEFVNFILWCNPLLSAYAEVKQAQDPTSFELNPPDKNHLHVFKCEDEKDCLEQVQRIQNFIQKFQESLLALKEEEGDQSIIVERQYIFKIPSTIKINSRKLNETFAAYMVDISDIAGNSATIVKRYSQFYSLNTRLQKKKKFSGKLPRMPKKKVINMDTNLIEKRGAKLEAYLNGLNNLPGAFDEPVVKRFLTTGVEDELGEDCDTPIDVEILPKAKIPKFDSTLAAISPSSSSSSSPSPSSSSSPSPSDSPRVSDAESGEGGDAPDWKRKSTWASSRGSVTTPSNPKPKKHTHIVVEAYVASKEGEMSVYKDQQLVFVESPDENWVLVRSTGGQKQGLVPARVVRSVEEKKPPAQPQRGRGILGGSYRK